MNSANRHEPSNYDLRAEVVAQLRRGRPLGDVAREYGISVADLCQWIAETVSAFESLTVADPEPVNDELTRLRLENECLRKQRDFYRKAAGIVAVDLVPERWTSDNRR